MTKKFYACWACLIFFTLAAWSQTADSLLSEAKQLVQAKQESQALQKYKEAVQADPQSTQALCGASFLSLREGGRQRDSKTKQSYDQQAKSYAETALKNSPGDRDANLAMAMALQQLSLTAGAKQKAAYIKSVKTYTDKALLIDSTYAYTWHVLGNWNFELSSLNFAERTATKLLFGGLPDASIDQAIVDYQKCRRLDPSYILNVLDLAMAYHAKSEDLQAIATCKEALRLRPIFQDDLALQQTARKMIEDLE